MSQELIVIRSEVVRLELAFPSSEGGASDIGAVTCHIALSAPGVHVETRCFMYLQDLHAFRRQLAALESSGGTDISSVELDAVLEVRLQPGGHVQVKGHLPLAGDLGVISFDFASDQTFFNSAGVG